MVSSIPSYPPSNYQPAAFAGDDREYPFYLSLFPSMSVGRGEGANRPWLQELPDTLTSAVWGSWIEINPRTAREHGLQAGELVRVVSPHGHIEAPIVFFPGIRPDTIAMPMGQGHSTYGRYAAGRGVNPLLILAPLFDMQSGALATGATRVRLEGMGQFGKLVLLEQRHEEKGHELITIGRRHTM
jgi:anaerobic selenocysteine-containing dehydrogenase